MYKVTIDGLSNTDANIVVAMLFKQDNFKAAAIEGGEGNFFSFRVVAETEHHVDAQELVDTMRMRGVEAKYEETRA